MTTVTRSIRFGNKGKRKRAVVDPAPLEAKDEGAGRVPRVARLMALAIRFDGLLRDGVVANQTELAKLARVTQPRMTQIMNLLHLAPDIQEEILFLPASAGGMTEPATRPIAAESSWSGQRRRWSEISVR